MPLNPSIILGYQPPKILSPEEKQAKSASLQNLLLGNKTAQMEYDTKSKEMQDNQAYKDYFKANPNATGNDLRGAGFVKQGYEADKFSSEQAKAKAENMKLQLENVKAKAEFGGQAANYVLKNPTIQNAHSAIDGLLQRGIITPEEAQAEKSSIPQDESQIAGWAEGHVRQATSIKDQLAKYEARDAGGTVQTQQIDPVTGQVKIVNTINKTQSPDNIATNQTSRLNNQDSNATSRLNNQNSVGATIRGQNLTDARAKETIAASGGYGGYSNKPLPAPALKLQNEGLDALANASNIDADIGGVINQMDKGKLNLGMVNKGVAYLKNNANMSDENSRNIGSFNATLEKLRNDSLRLNKGVQTDGDAQRAWNELMSNTNDQAFVKQRLEEIRKINQRGALLQKNNLDVIRSNYNAAPLDYSKYDSPDAAVGETKQNILPKNATIDKKPSVSNW